jgi:hypothetical protein
MTVVQPVDNGETERQAALEPGHPALPLLHRLLLESATETIDIHRVLGRLAAAFRVREAGLAGVNGDLVAIQRKPAYPTSIDV